MATAIGIAQQVDWDVPEQTGVWSDAWVRFRRNRLAVGGLAVIIVMIVLAIGARLPATPGGLWHILHITGDPVSQDVVNSYALPSLQHPLGTDILGRDQLSRILYGASISLTIGIVVQILILFIGGGIGMAAGYFGGWVDNLLMRFTDIMYAFPDLLLVLVFVAAFGPSFWGIGIRPPEPSWGVMIEDGYGGIFADPRQVIFPGIAVALTMLSFTFVGDGLRDALDPRMKR